MFRKTKKGIIEYDEGFAIRILGRAGLEYKEGSKIMLIDSEILNNPKVGYVVASSSISKWKGSKQKIGENDRLRILNNIKKAFKFIGYNIKIISDF